MKDKFLRGALILTIAGLLVKVLGSVNRIFLSRLLGGEGIGIYQIAYPIYLFITSISGAGVPIAISILVAKKVAKEDLRGAHRVFKVSLGLMAATGFIFAVALYFVANWLIGSGIIRDARAYYALVALVPAVFFATVLASARGYFQGYQMMTPPAVSQILEQFVRVIFMLSLAYYLLPYGLEYAAAGAAFSAVPGALTGLVVLGTFYYKHKELRSNTLQPALLDQEESISSIGKSLVLLALPVSCANLMLPLVTGIDMLMVPARLEIAGFSVKEATTAFGYLAGMALPLVSMSTIPTTSLAASVVPAISEAGALGQEEVIKEKSATALRLCMLLTLPCVVGLMVLGTGVSGLLYGTKLAGPVISAMAPSIFFLGLIQVTTGILQGMGYTVVPMLTMLLSAAVKVLCLWVLVANPLYNIIGAAWASNINFATAACLNLLFLAYVGRNHLPLLSFLRITLDSLIMGALVHAFYSYALTALGNIAAVLLAVIVGGISYVVLLILSREFSWQQLKALLKKRKVGK
jgi:stage V sporulation protein B